MNPQFKLGIHHFFAYKHHYIFFFPDFCNNYYYLTCQMPKTIFDGGFGRGFPFHKLIDYDLGTWGILWIFHPRHPTFEVAQLFLIINKDNTFQVLQIPPKFKKLGGQLQWIMDIQFQ